MIKFKFLLIMCLIHTHIYSIRTQYDPDGMPYEAHNQIRVPYQRSNNPPICNNCLHWQAQCNQLEQVNIRLANQIQNLNNKIQVLENQIRLIEESNISVVFHGDPTEYEN